MTAEGPAARGARRFDARRVYVALGFAPLFYLLVRYLPPVAFFALVCGAALIALSEFYLLYFRRPRPSLGLGLGLVAGLTLLASLQWPEVISDRAVFVGSVIAVACYRLFSPRSLQDSLTDVAVLLFGLLYVALTLGHLLLTRALENGEFLIFFVVLVTWAGDTGAYYAGRAFGRRRLAPTISPNKTIEGLLGGIALSVAVALVAQVWFLPQFTWQQSLGAAVLLSLVGVLGDLAESAMKRSAGVKDSSRLLSSHGGMLDRLDSMLFTAPVFYYYMLLVKA